MKTRVGKEAATRKKGWEGSRDGRLRGGKERRWPMALAYPRPREFLGSRTFSLKTKTVPGKPGPWVTLRGSGCMGLEGGGWPPARHLTSP